MKSALAYPKPTRVESPHYLAFVRQHPCCVPKCWKRPQASHVVFQGQGKVGSKVDDTQAVPHCEKHHLEYHEIGREAFERKYGLNLYQTIIDLLTEYTVLLWQQLKARQG